MGYDDSRREVTEYSLNENIFSDADTTFGITNCSTNTLAFKVTGKPKSNEQSELKTDERTICDTDGKELFRLRKEVVSRRKTVFIDDPTTNTAVHSMRAKHSLSRLRRLGIWEGEGFKGKPAFEIRGNVVKRDFEIFDKVAGQVAAIVCKDTISQSPVMIGPETYFVRVYSGYDDALMVTLAIALGEKCREWNTPDVMPYSIFCVGPSLDLAIIGLCFL